MKQTEFAKKLKSERARLNMSQRQAADFLGVGWGSVRDWEQCRRAPDAFKARAVLEALAGAEPLPDGVGRYNRPGC